MSNTKHTPGPWFVTNDKVKGFWIVIRNIHIPIGELETGETIWDSGFETNSEHGTEHDARKRLNQIRWS